MNNSFVAEQSLPDFPLWENMKNNRRLISFALELTARCNNDCAHCYINLPAGDRAAKEQELTLQEIERIADEAVSLGALWCLITGGEPLLREDFKEIYLLLKRKGLLISVFTNAVIINEEHIKLFKRYPPRDIEISVYGVTRETYEKVTRKPGSFKKFLHGVDLLMDSGVKVRFKAMALQSTVDELPQIAAFCRARTKDFFRFDPQLHMRFDRNEERNREIRKERLSPRQVAELEKADEERFGAMEKECGTLINFDIGHRNCNHLFHCGAGNGSFNIGFDGMARLCSSLYHPDCIFDLKTGTLKDFWDNFIPKVRDMRSDRKEYHDNCRSCPMVNLCLWCPAHAYLETGELDLPVDHFCKVAHARADSLKDATSRLKYGDGKKVT